MPVNWTNPYHQRQGRWLRGNLHAHAAPLSPCATMSLQDLFAAYVACGTDFLCVSEHMQATSPSREGLVLLPGFEWNSRSDYMAQRSLTYQHHVGVYSPDTALLDQAFACRAPDQLCAQAASPRSLLVANHPNWLMPEHYDQYTLQLLARDLDGLEIYNAELEWDEGEAEATNRWDRLLSQGEPLLGFAGDDAHDTHEVGKAWITARVADGENPVQAVFEALKSGNFYCSTGASIQDIGRDKDTLFLSLEAEARIRIYGWGGRLLFEQVGSEAEWSFNGQKGAGKRHKEYARFHIMDRDWGQAWSQPFFRHATE